MPFFPGGHTRLRHLLILLTLLLAVTFSGLARQILHFQADDNCQADIIVVMGAAQYNGQPSPAFKRRLDQALVLYRQDCAERILVTGGVGDGDIFSEGAVGVNYLSAQGVVLADLQSERYSRTSFQNLAYSLPHLNSHQVLIVTDDYHAFRTRWLARHLGLDVELAVVRNQKISLSHVIHELAALAVYFFGIFR